MAAQDPFSILKTGWTGVPVTFEGTVWATPPVFASDGETVLTDGVPLDLSGWTFMFTVKRSYFDADAAAVYAHDWVQADAAGGVWFFELPDSVTATMQPGFYPWDCKIIRAGGGHEPEMFLAGRIQIANTVGRRTVPDL